MADIRGRIANRIQSRERQRQILDLRLMGATFEAIAKQLGISPQASHKAYRRALAAITAPSVEAEHAAQTERINRAEYLLNAEIEKLRGQQGASDQIARLSLVLWKWECRRSSLLGLDSPKAVQIIEDGRMPLDQVRAIMEEARSRLPPVEPEFLDLRNYL
jgi:hypothetical protein